MCTTEIKQYKKKTFSSEEGGRYGDSPIFRHIKVLQIQPSSAQNTELKRLGELDRKTQQEYAHFTFRNCVKNKKIFNSGQTAFLWERAERVCRRALLVFYYRK